MRKFLIITFTITVLFAQFDWVQNGLPVRQGVHIEWQRSADSGEDGNLILVWSDTRSGGRDVFIQKVNPAGEALWNEDGVIVVNADGRQEDPQVISDGSGGAYVVWIDYRNEPDDGDVYGQYVNASGEIMWGEEGVPLTIVPGKQVELNSCYDGNGGAFIIWKDESVSLYGHTYGTHLTPDQGDIIAPETGIPILASPEQHNNVSIETGGIGYANLVWGQISSGEESDLYSQRIDSQCNTVWSANDENGVIVCDVIGKQENPKINNVTETISAIVWEDRRFNSEKIDIFIQFIDENGSVLLDSEGVMICGDSEMQSEPRVKAENGYAFVAWQDERNFNYDVYAQKVSIDGNIHWESDGKPISTEFGNQTKPRLTTDGFGGVYFIWQDERNSNSTSMDIYLQHVKEDNTLSFQNNGLNICTVEGKQEAPVVRPDNNGGALTVWGDKRTGSIGLYVQYVDPDFGTTLDDDGVELYFGTDGNVIDVSSVYLGDERSLIYWEDTRWGSANPSVYGMIINSNYENIVNEYGTSSSFIMGSNPFTSFPKIVRSGDYLFMNFITEDEWGTFLQYYTIFEISDNLSPIGNPEGQPLYVPAFVSNQNYSRVSVGDDGYFYVAWSDVRFEISWGSYALFAQKYDALGVPQWSEEGVLVGALDGDNIVSDIKAIPGGGCIMTWAQEDAGNQYLYSRLLDGDGNIGEGWEEPAEIAVLAGDHSGFKSVIGPTGYFGVWKDTRNGNADIYGQFIEFNGTLGGEPNGFSVSTKSNDQQKPTLSFSESTNEILVCWEDFVNGNDWDIYCTQINMTDLILLDEIELAVMSGSGQNNPFVFTSDNGTFMISWQDTRTSLAADIYYQEIQNGNLVFELGGTVLCDVSFKQERPKIGKYSHTNNHYFIYWLDGRSSGKEDLINLYTQSRMVSGGCGTGDVNGDGTVNVLDVVMAVGIVLENITPTPDQFFEADVNCDNSINVLDIVFIVNIIVGP
ncbi:MAG: hypothetical protein HQ510_10170 [Candidatus Marinimicrobia bacterium]|nr:hypothetical protein [Candidatus Neomarinimicrobiota bacterium]